jgi:hypothetical protein
LEQNFSWVFLDFDSADAGMPEKFAAEDSAPCACEEMEFTHIAHPLILPVFGFGHACVSALISSLVPSWKACCRSGHHWCGVHIPLVAIFF